MKKCGRDTRTRLRFYIRYDIIVPTKRNFERGNDILNRKKEACHCKNVTYGMIEDAVRNGADTLQQVMEVTGAGKGCGKCKGFLEYLIRDIKEEQRNL